MARIMRNLALLFAPAIGCFILWGCAPDPGWESGPASVPEPAAELPEREPAEPLKYDFSYGTDRDLAATVVYWGWDSHMTGPLLPEFHKEFPGIDIQVVPVASANYLTKLQQTVASGGSLPDILVAEINYRYLATRMDIWEELESGPYYVNRSEFAPYIQNQCVNDRNMLVAIPNSLTSAGMAYKRNLTRQYFGTDDRAELETLFSSFEAYIEEGERVQMESGGKVFLFHSPALLMEWLYFSDDAPLVAEDGALDITGKMTPLFELLRRFRDAGIVGRHQNYTPASDASYADDENIFYPCPSWALSYNIKPNDPEGAGRWGLMMPHTGGYSAGGTAKGIAKSSEVKEAAWAFIQWCAFAAKGADTAKREVGYYSPVRSILSRPGFTSYRDPFFAGQDTADFFFREAAARIPSKKLTPYDQLMFDYNGLMAQALVSDPTLTTAEIVERYVREAQASLPDAVIR